MMEKLKLKSLCHINTNIGEDTFVGISMEDDAVKVCFPIGYRLSNDDKEIRKDILLLLRVLKQFSDLAVNYEDRKDSFRTTNSFPIFAYHKVMLHYLDHGCYYENEVNYKDAKRGKINWSRTIKTHNPVIVGDATGYFDFSVKNIENSKITIITAVNEYCVYESIYKIGWLYNIPLPIKPRIKFKKELFLSELQNKLKITFNDKTKDLLKAMIEIVSNLNPNGEQNKKFGYGTNRFEYVWERVIDYIYGIKEKADYFPKTTWTLNSGNHRINSPLVPDTIMLFNGDVYILDAKYYKFGTTGYPTNLPDTSSISKQITYGEYVERTGKSKGGIYNAFVIPYEKTAGLFPKDDKIISIGEATADWKNNYKDYEKVVGILVDITDLMQQYSHSHNQDIMQMAKVISVQLKNP